MAITEYCTLEDLETLGMGGRAFRDRPAPEKLAAIRTASSLIDSYLRNQYTLPLMTIGEDLRQCCAVLACYTLLRVKGFDPSADGNEIIMEERDRQVKWLEGIARGNTAPMLTDSAVTARGFGTGPRVATSNLRGYSPSDGYRGAFSRSRN